jgi:hypothetical protein
VAFCRPDNQIREAPTASGNISAATGDFLEKPLRNWQLNSLLGLAQRKDTPFLVCTSIADLQNAMSKLARTFFQNLHSILKKPGACVDKVLKPFRKGDTKDIVEM